MNIAVFGLGYVGTTCACCLSQQGHSVVGIDIDESKVRQVNAGQCPIAEPGLQALLAQGRDDKRLRASTAIGNALDDADLAIVCVGTPSAPDGAHDLGDLARVCRDIAGAIDRRRRTRLTLVVRSTVKPGTTETLVEAVLRGVLQADFERLVEIVYCPEFMRESSMVADYFDPARVVVGTIDARPSAIMDALFAGLSAPRFNVGFREAELIKLVDNAWHAVKVTYANEIGRLCRQLEVSAATIQQLFVADTKLNLSAHYTRPGNPFGGSCLPKDVRAIQALASGLGAPTPLLHSLLDSNEAHQDFLFAGIVERVRPPARVLLVGLAFKAGTDDVRESPYLDLAVKLVQAGFVLSIHDPAVELAHLSGRNRSHAYARLAGIETLLVGKAEAEGGVYDLVIGAGEQMRGLRLDTAAVLDLSVMS